MLTILLSILSLITGFAIGALYTLANPFLVASVLEFIAHTLPLLLRTL